MLKSLPNARKVKQNKEREFPHGFPLFERNLIRRILIVYYLSKKQSLNLKANNHVFL